MRTLAHVPALDGLRGIAILLVLGWHSDHLLPGGSLGVNLFFVLSGFLITSLLLREHHETGRVSLAGFYRRRALRLLPALGFAIAVATATVALTDPARITATLRAVPYAVSFTMNMPFATWTDELGVLWSLSQEEQFYLVWPPLLIALIALARGRVRPWALAMFLAGLFVVAAGWRTALLFGDASAGRLWFRPDANADSILLGCLTGVVYTYRLVRLPSELCLVAVPAAALIVGFFAWGTPLFFLLIPIFALACALTIHAVASEPGCWLARAMSFAPLRVLGRISYALYLLHLSMFFALGWKLGLPAAIALAAISYRFVERPFLRRKSRAPRRSVAERLRSHHPGELRPGEPLTGPAGAVTYGAATMP